MIQGALWSALLFSGYFYIFLSSIDSFLEDVVIPIFLKKKKGFLESNLDL